MAKNMFLAMVVAAVGTPVASQDWSAEIYGGKLLDDTLMWDLRDYETGRGQAFGIGLYNHSMVEGIALGVDIMSSGFDYPGFTDSMSAVSVMLAARYALPLTDTLSATLGAGVGGMVVSYDRGDEIAFSNEKATVAGGQVELGLRHRMGNTTELFGAVKYQSTFGDVEFDNGLVADYKGTSVIFGISFRM